MKRMFKPILNKGKICLFFDRYEDHFAVERHVNIISPETVKVVGKDIGTCLKIVDSQKWSDIISQMIEDDLYEKTGKMSINC